MPNSLSGGLPMGNHTEPTTQEWVTTLIQHDADIKSIRGDMHGMKSDMHGMKSDIKDLGALVSSNQSTLSKIDAKLDGQQNVAAASKGPGFGQIILFAGGICAILGSVATGIMMLVSSNIAPELTMLKANLAEVQGKARANDEQDRADFQRLKSMRSQEITDALKDLKMSVDSLKAGQSWGSGTIVTRK